MSAQIFVVYYEIISQMCSFNLDQSCIVEWLKVAGRATITDTAKVNVKSNAVGLSVFTQTPTALMTDSLIKTPQNVSVYLIILSFGLNISLHTDSEQIVFNYLTNITVT